MRLAKLLVAVLLLTVLWGLSLVRDSQGLVRVRPLNTKAGPVRILRFYATAGSVAPGEMAQLCYSVENAKIIRIAPLVENVSGDMRHCVEIHPEHTTHYTLQAEGFDGTVAMRSVTLAVQSAPLAPAQVQQVASLTYREPLADARGSDLSRDREGAVFTSCGPADLP